MPSLRRVSSHGGHGAGKSQSTCRICVCSQHVGGTEIYSSIKGKAPTGLPPRINNMQLQDAIASCCWPLSATAQHKRLAALPEDPPSGFCPRANIAHAHRRNWAPSQPAGSSPSQQKREVAASFTASPGLLARAAVDWPPPAAARRAFGRLLQDVSRWSGSTTTHVAATPTPVPTLVTVRERGRRASRQQLTMVELKQSNLARHDRYCDASGSTRAAREVGLRNGGPPCTALQRSMAAGT